MHSNESWRPLFGGCCQGAIVQFICLSSGSVAILHGERVIRWAGMDEMDSILNQFMEMIDRPMRPRSAPPVPGARRAPWLLSA